VRQRIELQAMPVRFDGCKIGTFATVVALAPAYPAVERLKFLGERSDLSNVAAGITVGET
jgi:hypothetical protein